MLDTESLIQGGQRTQSRINARKTTPRQTIPTISFSKYRKSKILKEPKEKKHTLLIKEKR